MDVGALDGGRSLGRPSGGPRGLRALRWQTIAALQLSWLPGTLREGEPLSDRARQRPGAAYRPEDQVSANTRTFA